MEQAISVAFCSELVYKPFSFSLQAAAGKRPKRTASDNVRLCFKCLDWLVILGLVALILYLMQVEYGIDVIGVAAAAFPREAEVIGRVVRDVMLRF